MKAVKTSRKHIERMGGIKAAETNIYTYENLLYYLTGGKVEKEDVKCGCISEKSYDFIAELKKDTGYKHASYETYFYARGMYGVIGRYDNITLYDKDWNAIDSFNLKFC